MLPKELVRKLRRIQIYTDRLVDEALAGQYASAFKGTGMDFAEVRQYQPGDEVRRIDWNVTARMGTPYVKTYEEERELTVLLLVDLSASTKFGTKEQLKSELIAEFCAVLGFSALKNNDRVGMGIFTDRMELFVPPKKGRRHVLRLIREVLYFQSDRKGTDLEQALSFVNRVLTRRAVVFLISDFEDTGYERTLKVAQRRHDIIAVRVLDQRERSIPKLGLVSFVDPETGEHFGGGYHKSPGASSPRTASPGPSSGPEGHFQSYPDRLDRHYSWSRLHSSTPFLFCRPQAEDVPQVTGG